MPTSDEPRAAATAGTVIQVPPKLLGCGCFGCSSVLILGGTVALVALVLVVLVPDWRVNRRYELNTCEVLDLRVASRIFNDPADRSPNPRQKESYRPEVRIRYEVQGRAVETWAYDAFGAYSDNRAAQRAAIDRFEVGSTHPCWYDPDRPDRAVLVRGHALWGYVALTVPVGMMAVGVAGVVLAYRLSTAQTLPVGPDGAPLVPRWASALQPPPVSAEAINAAHFNDPVALKTDWGPTGVVVSNVRTHKLVEADPDRLIFRPTVPGVLASGASLLAGAGMILVPTYALFAAPLPFGTAVVLMSAGLIFAVLGGVLLRSVLSPVVLDKRVGWVWKGWRGPTALSEGDNESPAAPLRDVHALQVITYLRQGNPTSNNVVYELNVVLHNGRRLNAARHNSRFRIRNEAETLAKFLGKPVWDAIV